VCGLDEGRVFLDRSLPTSEALADPSTILALIDSARPLDLIAGPSGYGLPVVSARELTDDQLRLASLAARGERGGIGGLNALIRTLARQDVPVVLTPGVIHLPSVSRAPKGQSVDMGTADKVCAAALAVWEQAAAAVSGIRDVSHPAGTWRRIHRGSCIDGGAIVDGIGGSSGPLGVRASGALDAEVAFLAGRIGKELVFRGGAAAIAGMPDATIETIAATPTPAARLAWEAYLESAVKAVATLLVSVPRPAEIIMSGRLARNRCCPRCIRRAARADHRRAGPSARRFRRDAAQAAQGAALLAVWSGGGATMALVKSLRIREASGTALDHLFVISPADAKARLGNHVTAGRCRGRVDPRRCGIGGACGFTVTAVDAFADSISTQASRRCRAARTRFALFGDHRHATRTNYRSRRHRVPVALREPSARGPDDVARSRAVGQLPRRPSTYPRPSRARPHAATSWLVRAADRANDQERFERFERSERSERGLACEAAARPEAVVA
jgi:predicted butyrate kinase (DUF1464 family)